MRRSAPHSQRDGGFALVGVMVLIAILAIASVAFGVIYLRQLDQQRQIQTTRSLETAFHGLFPGHQRPAANMWKDFGFRPDVPATPPGGYDLRCLTTLAQVRIVQASQSALTAYSGSTTLSAEGRINAWNGPYWQGSVDGLNRPVDGWGRPILLRYISTPTPTTPPTPPGWQVISGGVNGLIETGNSETPAGDDQVYPQPPYEIPTLGGLVTLPESFLLVNWVDINGAEQIRVVVENLVEGVWVTVLNVGNYAINKNRDYQAPAVTIQAGLVRITVYRKPGGSWVPVLGFPKTYTVPPTISEVVNLS